MRLLFASSGAFWQDESYEHLVRDSQSFDRIRHYIAWNPVKARLAGTPQELRVERDAAGRAVGGASFRLAGHPGVIDKQDAVGNTGTAVFAGQSHIPSLSGNDFGCSGAGLNDGQQAIRATRAEATGHLIPAVICFS